ncbi:MAG: metallophosphoesterase [Syntrophorhabdaceae bacterium]|nr:metallophosphoesterase [Syntrophorhabdaceae bacterium]
MKVFKFPPEKDDIGLPFFLLAFFLIYGTMHAYVFLKARAAFGFGWTVGAPLFVLFAFLVSAPVLAAHLLVRHGHGNVAQGVALTGFVWMGFLFFLVGLNVAADAARFLCLPAQRWFGFAGNCSFALGGRGVFLLIVVLAVAFSAYSVFEAHNIRIVHIRIATDKLAPGIKTVRVAQISDLHLGLIHRSGKAQRVADLVAAQRPDILVSTGDLVDGRLTHIEGLAGIFREIHTPMGKFAVNGNHEYYAGLSHAISFTQDAGFTLLRDEVAVAGEVIRIIGVDDPAQKHMMTGSGRPEPDIPGSGADDRFTIILKHRPVVDPDMAGKFDLQLSGHSHQGQLFPFLLLTRLSYPCSGGSYALPEGGTLHVNRGTGTWGPPMRFLAPPEITIIDLERQP